MRSPPYVVCDRIEVGVRSPGFSRKRRRSSVNGPPRTVAAATVSSNSVSLPLSSSYGVSTNPQPSQGNASTLFSAARSRTTLPWTAHIPVKLMTPTPKLSRSARPVRHACQASPATRNRSRGTSVGSKEILYASIVSGASIWASMSFHPGPGCQYSVTQWSS